MTRTETHQDPYSRQFSTSRYYDEHPDLLTATVRHGDYSLEIHARGRSGQIIADVCLGPQGSVKAALAAADAYVATATVESIRADASARAASRAAQHQVALAAALAEMADQPAPAPSVPTGDWDDHIGARAFTPRRR